MNTTTIIILAFGGGLIAAGYAKQFIDNWRDERAVKDRLKGLPEKDSPVEVYRMDAGFSPTEMNGEDR